jgi:hypothetical protein
MTVGAKAITNLHVVTAYVAAQACKFEHKPYWFLGQWTGQSHARCVAAMQQCHEGGLVDFDISLSTGWLTEAGMALFELAAASAEGQA